MKTLPALFALVAVVVAGCTYGNRISYETTKRPPKNPATVEVFDVRDVKRPYKVIGVVSSDSWYMHSALKACRTEAAALGADAIIEFGPNGNTSGVGVANPMGAGDDLFEGHGITSVSQTKTSTHNNDVSNVGGNFPTPFPKRAILSTLLT